MGLRWRGFVTREQEGKQELKQLDRKGDELPAVFAALANTELRATGIGTSLWEAHKFRFTFELRINLLTLKCTVIKFYLYRSETAGRVSYEYNGNVHFDSKLRSVNIHAVGTSDAMQLDLCLTSSHEPPASDPSAPLADGESADLTGILGLINHDRILCKGTSPPTKFAPLSSLLMHAYVYGALQCVWRRRWGRC